MDTHTSQSIVIWNSYVKAANPILVVIAVVADEQGREWITREKMQKLKFVEVSIKVGSKHLMAFVMIRRERRRAAGKRLVLHAPASPETEPRTSSR
jgi:hypothetical protein